MNKSEMNQVAFRYSVLRTTEDAYSFDISQWPEEVRQLIEYWGGSQKIEADAVDAVQVIKGLSYEDLNKYIEAVGPSYLRFRLVEELIDREKGA